jgi:hypothetical protein
MRSFGVRRLPVVDQGTGRHHFFYDLLGDVRDQVTDLAALMICERQHEAEVRP